MCTREKELARLYAATDGSKYNIMKQINNMNKVLDRHKKNV